MAITVSCACGKVMSVPDSLAGKKGKCPGCQAVITIPVPGGAPAPSTKAAPAAPAKPATGRVPVAPKPATGQVPVAPRPLAPELLRAWPARRPPPAAWG
ncbi:MAG: hypothetical protein RDV41_14155, partial [Planctomycetota bacterium]|nr:hypothetical protein [Planctomycetota bacterium]